MSTTPERAPRTARPDLPVHASAGHHVVDFLAFHNAAFFGSERFDLHPGFNCIVGGMGSGKTTVLQSVRHALTVPATDPRAEQNHAQVMKTLGDGELEIGVTNRHGRRFRAKRRGDAPPRVTTETGEHAPVSLDGDLFKLEIYAQNQVFTMAEDKRAQLALIDKFALTEIETLTQAIAEVDRRLVANEAQRKRLAEEIEGGAQRTRDLPSVAAALEALGQVAGPDAAEAKRAHALKVARGREQAALRGLREELRATQAASTAFEAEAQQRLGSPLPATLAGSPNYDVLARAHAEHARVVASVREAAALVSRAVASAEAALSSASDLLGPAHAAQEKAYEELVRKLDLDRGRVAERERLQRRFLELESEQKRLDACARELEARTAERQTLIEKRASKLAERHAVRLRVAREIVAQLGGEIVVDVVAGGDTEDYLELLIELTRGANIRPPELLAAIADKIHPTDLAALVREGDPSAIVALDESKTGKPDRARRILDALRASGRLGELETVTLGDSPIIKLRVGDNYLVLSSDLSSGQRCTAILPILLIQSATTLVIDQPEDQVDNAYIYRVLVKTLRKMKLSRQIIFATHNPNLLVVGEADRVFILRGSERTSRIGQSGDLDALRAGIEEHVEGGREAFLLRAARYGHR